MKPNGPCTTQIADVLKRFKISESNNLAPTFAQLTKVGSL